MKFLPHIIIILVATASAPTADAQCPILTDQRVSSLACGPQLQAQSDKKAPKPSKEPGASESSAKSVIRITKVRGFSGGVHSAARRIRYISSR